jgi:hypothetical protein
MKAWMLNAKDEGLAMTAWMLNANDPQAEANDEGLYVACRLSASNGQR